MPTFSNIRTTVRFGSTTIFSRSSPPSLAFLDGAADTVKDGVKYCQKHEIAHLLSYKGLTRLRTDGSIWVIDYLKEENADRELPYTPGRE